MKGKQRQIISDLADEEHQKLDAMNRDELREMEKDLEEAMARHKANSLSIPENANNNVPDMIETDFQQPDTTRSGSQQQEMFSTPSSRISKGFFQGSDSDNLVSESDMTPSLWSTVSTIIEKAKRWNILAELEYYYWLKNQKKTE